MSVQHMRVAAVTAVLALSAAGYADEAEQSNPDSRALLEYVKKLEARVDQLEQEKQWPLDQVRGQSGSALESAVRAINLSGYMEYQYSYNFRHGGDGATRGDTLGFNTFGGSSADENGFSFQNLQLMADKPLTTIDSTGFRVRAEYGLVSQFNNRDGSFTDTGNAFAVREAYMSWRTNFLGIAEHTDLSVGMMDTPIGMETPDANDPNNFGLVTRSYMHNVATPQTHTGLRAAMPWSECCKTTVYFVNGWDNVRDAADGKTLIVSHEMGKLEFLNSTITANVSYGNEGGGIYPGFSTSGGPAVAPDGNKVALGEIIWRGEIDENNTFAVDALVSRADKGALNAATGDIEEAETHAIAGYIRHQLSTKGWLSARGEWFASTVAGGTNLRGYEISVALGWDLTTDLTVAVEYRHDHATSFEPFQGKTADSFMDSQDRVTASVIYSF